MQEVRGGEKNMIHHYIYGGERKAHIIHPHSNIKGKGLFSYHMEGRKGEAFLGVFFWLKVYKRGGKEEL